MVGGSGVASEPAATVLPGVPSVEPPAQTRPPGHHWVALGATYTSHLHTGLQRASHNWPRACLSSIGSTRFHTPVQTSQVSTGLPTHTHNIWAYPGLFTDSQIQAGMFFFLTVSQWDTTHLFESILISPIVIHRIFGST